MGCVHPDGMVNCANFPWVFWSLSWLCLCRQCIHLGPDSLGGLLPPPYQGSVLACVSGNPFSPQHLPDSSVNVLRSLILLEPRIQKDLWGLFLDLVPFTTNVPWFFYLPPSLSLPPSFSHPPFQISCNPGWSWTHSVAQDLKLLILLSLPPQC